MHKVTVTHEQLRPPIVEVCGPRIPQTCSCVLVCLLHTIGANQLRSAARDDGTNSQWLLSPYLYDIVVSRVGYVNRIGPENVAECQGRPKPAVLCHMSSTISGETHRSLFLQTYCREPAWAARLDVPRRVQYYRSGGSPK